MQNLGGQSSWIWLSGLRTFERIVVIDWPHPIHVHSAASQFRTVVAISDDPDRCRALANDPGTRAATNIHIVNASPAHLPLSGAGIDCAVLHIASIPGSRMAEAQLESSAAECARVLAASGWIFATWENWKWHRRLLAGLRPGRGGAVEAAEKRGGSGSSPDRILARAGFRDPRPYYLSPSVNNPWQIIPIQRDALLTMTRGRMQRALVRLRCHALLFPDRLLMATK